MFKKLSVRLAVVTIIVMTVIIAGFTYYLIKDRSEKLNEMILEKGVTASKIGATAVKTILENVIDHKRFTLNQIMDQTLVPIEYPEKISEAYANISDKNKAAIKKYNYKTKLDSYLETRIVQIEDKFLEDPQFVYAAVMDSLGYAPAHNTRYNKPLTGNFNYDIIYSRSKRVYTDPVALKICANTRNPYLRQTYKRDTGEEIWDISSPIYVKGKHWGAFRVGLSMEKTRKATAALGWKLAGMMGTLLVIVVVVISWISTAMMRPLDRLHDGVNRVAKGDLSYRQEVVSNDEIGDLASAFNDMVIDLKDHIEKLKMATAAKERMESELKIAHDIQMGIVPKIFPPFPHRKEFDIFAVLKPAWEVGGDFFDFFFIDDNRFCFVIGDVSGKGVPASLFMAITTTLIKTIARETSAPSDILSKVNRELIHENESCIFVTLFCGVLNILTGEVEYSRGGHNPPFVIRSKNGIEYLNGGRSPIVGVFEDAIYIKDKIILQPQDTICFYTDGVTEAFDAAKHQFTEERFKDVLIQCKDVSIKEMVVKTLEAISSHSKNTPQSDDITIMVLRYFTNQK